MPKPLRAVTLFHAMMFLFHREKSPTLIVGVVISLIVLALGAFLYMKSEEDVNPLQTSKSGQSVSSTVMEAAVQGEPMVVSDGQGDKPFIMAIIPGEAVLEGGSYRISPSTLRVRVRAVNVTGGSLYFKPASSKQIEVQSDEKIGDLTPSSDLPGEYELPFELKKDMSGLLIAVMKGNNGQEVQLSVNVAAK